MKTLVSSIYRIALAVLLAVVCLSPASLHAQVDAQLSQYWAVPTYYNPAAAGNTDFIHITAGSRLQWVGVRHAPQTFLALADMPLKVLGKRIGVGVELQQETMGLYSSVNAGAQFSYKRRMFGGTLSAGVQLGFINETFKGSKVDIPEGDNAHTKNDDAIPASDVAGTAFDINAGVHFEHKWFWVSASSTHVTEPAVTLKVEDSEDQQYEFKAGRVYYFMAGSNIPIKNTLFELQPSVFFKTDAQFYQVEATARVRYNKFISGGVAYRHKDAVSVMIGAEFKNVFFGYAFDWPTSALSRVSNGSHEVFVTYNMKLDLNEKNKNRHKSIRIM